MDLVQELQARNLIHDIMPGTQDQLNKEMTAGYIGFDPTADSLHVGSMLQITLLKRLQQAGHKPYALVGGATGMIGDPTGKSAERNLLNREIIDKNCAGIRKQLERFLDFDDSKPNAAVMVNNYDWLKDYTFLDFIRDIGKHITVGYMMSKDSVKNRLETGLSFTEFSYQLIQGFDFYHLFKEKGLKLQMGGADQWGNILTGTELIRRMSGGEAFAMTSPLITKSDGGKFGKTETGTIWLDRERTSPYQFYQFWLKLADADAEKLALSFSFKPVEEIQALIEEHRLATHQRKLQKALAEEITELVHSKEDLQFAQQASEILFGNTAVEALTALNEKQLLEVMDGLPLVKTTRAILDEGFDFLALLAENKVFGSKGEARKMIQAGGFSINKEKMTAPDHKIEAGHLLNDKYLLLQKGKKDYTLLIVE
ncbi:MAG TPA: tyrosine--tRNA ligase [Flavipsychrobacter sp.]|nr:tyrosine--tRNA ligase [Flavipsychrobacter sp.]